MKMMRIFVVVLSFVWLMGGLTGCAEKGPMEKAGKKIDKAAAEMKKAARDTKDSVKNLFKKKQHTTD